MKSKENNLSKKQFNSLVKKIANCDKNALDNFYSVYGKMIYSVAFSILKSSYLADETVDDVLVKIWQTASKLKNFENPVGWLYTVTANLAKDKFKSEKRLAEIYDVPQDDKNIEELIDKDSFLSYISALNEEEQQIIIFKIVQGLSFKLIAKEINKPQSSVSSIYYRALEKLKTTIK